MSASSERERKASERELQESIAEFDVAVIPQARNYLAKRFLQGELHVGRSELRDAMGISDEKPLFEFLLDLGIIEDRSSEHESFAVRIEDYTISPTVLEFAREERKDVIAEFQRWYHRHRFWAWVIIGYVVIQAVLQLFIALRTVLRH